MRGRKQQPSRGSMAARQSWAPLRERVTPAAHQEIGEWAVDRFYAEDGVLMYGGGPAEDVFAKLIAEMTA